MNQAPKQCGSCRYFHTAMRTLCKRYPPTPVDNRNSRYPAICWDDSCGEWTAVNENILVNAP